MAKGTPMAGKDVDHLLKAMLVLSRTVEHVLESRAVEAAVKKPLSPSKVQILRLLGQRDGQTSTQVARFLGVSKPAVTQIIDSMIRDKLVTRRAGKEDRREVSLQLSQKGRDAFQAIRKAQRHYVRTAMKNGKSREAGRWTTLLQDASKALAQADDAYQHFCAQCGAHEDDTCVLVGGDAECLYLQPTRRTAPRRKASRRG